MQHRITFIGQIHPRIGSWYFDETISVKRDDETIQIIIRESLFNVRIDTDGPDDIDDAWIEKIWLRCLVPVRTSLDILGFHVGADLQIERLTALVNDVAVLFFGTSQPRFQIGTGDRVEGDVTDPLFHESMNNPSFRHALGDVRLAQALDDDCAFYCYRAIEGLRQAFVLAGESEKTEKGKSWERLRAELDVTHKQIGAIANAAKARRHGGHDTSELDERLGYVRLTRELIVRFVNQLPKPETGATPILQSGGTTVDSTLGETANAKS